VLLLGAVVFVVTALGSVVLGMDVGIASVALGSMATSFLAVEHGLIAIAVGAATGRRAIAIAVAAAVAVGGYLLYVLGQLLPQLEPWSVLSPFRQALEGGPVAPTLSLAFVAVVAVGAAVVLLAAPRWNRRDLAT
jgi:ABC-2 type transport system permease protein